jgi:hypothetical protein
VDDLLMLAGSEVVALACDPLTGLAELRLAAAQVLRDGRLGHLMGVRLRFTGARCEGAPGDAFGRINDARLQLGAAPARSEWPLRQAFAQPLALSLVMGHGATLVLHASTLQAACADGRFVESHAC